MAWERYESIFIAYVFYTRKKKFAFVISELPYFSKGSLKSIQLPCPMSLIDTFQRLFLVFICLASIVCELIEEKRVPLKQMA